MAAVSECTLFTQAVSKILNSWTALQIAVRQGFGGPDSKEKAEWLVTAVVTWFSENSDIETFEMEDFLEDLLNAEFDLLLEDGSIKVVANHICQSYSLVKAGQVSELEEKLQLLPKAVAEQCQKAASNDEEMVGEDMETSFDRAGPTNQAPLSLSEPSGSSVQAENASHDRAAEDVQMEEEDGWTVVKKGKKR